MSFLRRSIFLSLFGVIREMLYVPLQLDEKFRAKAIIDVFAYRTSKALDILFLERIK
jgi:ATP/ADP translocase